jgi:hypothetical protein
MTGTFTPSARDSMHTGPAASCGPRAAAGAGVPGISRAALPRQARRPVLAPQWLQVLLIVGLLAAAVYVWLDGWHIWAGLLTVAALAFGASFLLRRMVGDEYGRA